MIYEFQSSRANHCRALEPITAEPIPTPHLLCSGSQTTHFKKQATLSGDICENHNKRKSESDTCTEHWYARDTRGQQTGI